MRIAHRRSWAGDIGSGRVGGGCVGLPATPRHPPAGTGRAARGSKGFSSNEHFFRYGMPLRSQAAVSQMSPRSPGFALMLVVRTLHPQGANGPRRVNRVQWPYRIPSPRGKRGQGASPVGMQETDFLCSHLVFTPTLFPEKAKALSR